MEMVCQRVGQILCGYEDANDCDRLRGDSALKMSCGRKPSDEALCSQPTMTRLENNVGSRTLYKISKLFLDEYISSFDKAPKKVVIDADDTNANTYGGQQLTLFNAYYEDCTTTIRRRRLRKGTTRLKGRPDAWTSTGNASSSGGISSWNTRLRHGNTHSASLPR